MDVIYILLSISVIIAIAFLVAFIWSVKRGQYEDIVSPSIRILYDSENESSISINTSSETQKSNNYGTQHEH
ncbi:MAG: cbb3-type cytochrome oxidase assembly protein CcoS [Bacteroidia bacterium]|nr:cbb3-type cytochrome oxidase assembly protein CcoS [Bacteroidia bacterium]